MTRPIIKIVNVTTGEEIERQMNQEELAVYEQGQQNSQARAQAETEKAQARSAAEAKLLELGLTSEDLKALLG
jgi:trehalose utilization protein